MDNCEICREHANGGTYYDDADCYICNLQAENAKLRNIAETALKLRGRLKEVGIDTPWLDGALQEAGYNV